MVSDLAFVGDISRAHAVFVRETIRRMVIMA
jgi:hypothetical protein